MSKRTIEKHIKYNAEEWNIISKKAAGQGKRGKILINKTDLLNYLDMSA